MTATTGTRHTSSRGCLTSSTRIGIGASFARSARGAWPAGPTGAPPPPACPAAMSSFPELGSQPPSAAEPVALPTTSGRRDAHGDTWLRKPRSGRKVPTGTSGPVVGVGCSVCASGSPVLSTADGVGVAAGGASGSSATDVIGDSVGVWLVVGVGCGSVAGGEGVVVGSPPEEGASTDELPSNVRVVVAVGCSVV